MPENMEPMKTFTVGADTWEVVDGAARDELADARTGADGTEYESTGAAIRGAVEGINGDLEENYAMQDGYYEMLTAGSADKLTGRGDGVGAEFVRRTLAGNADVADGIAKIESIKGNTVRWNQLAYVSGVILEPVSSSNYVNKNILQTHQFNAISGHKYLSSAEFTKIDDTNNIYVYYTGISSQGILCSASEPKKISVASDNLTVIAQARFSASSYPATIGGKIENFMIIDLTAMFGAGNEPATVEEFEALFPASYYPYDAGSLLNVNMQGVRTVGFNQWDESMEEGVYDGQTGNKVVSTSFLRSVNKVPVKPGAQYFCKAPSGITIYSYAFDASGAFVRNSGLSVPANGTFTVPNGVHYFAFAVSKSQYGNAYDNDICINFAWSGYRNGEYEGYWQRDLAIDAATYFPDGMKSAGSVYDELQADKAVTRVGVIDLGTRSWSLLGSKPNTFYVQISGGVGAPNSSTIANIKCAKYMPGTYTAGTNDNGYIAFAASTNCIYITDTDYTDAAAFKASLDGVMFYYELATPIETLIEPPINLRYKVSDFGTEEIIFDETQDAPQTAPARMQIVYGTNAVDTIRRLPVEYISHESFTRFLSAIESHFNVTITETYDSDNRRYNYSIAGNESGE